jgi:serine phosphatase RsbU (regulator of sigma subunit)
MRATTDSPAHLIACTEVWGGFGRFDGAVQTPGIEAYVICEPFQQEVSGGDVHFLTVCSQGQLTRLAVADVAGHGAEAAHLAERLRDLMRLNMNTLDQTSFVRELNRSFAEVATDGRFATAALISYYPAIDRIIACNAGHPRPLWYRADQQRWVLLDHRHRARHREAEPTDLPLGVIDQTQYHQFEVRPSPQDLFVVYSDSLIEVRQPSGLPLGERGLLQLARSLGRPEPQSIGRQLVHASARLAHAERLGDDVTIVALQCRGGSKWGQSVRSA